jgi:hypothetical protein
MGDEDAENYTLLYKWLGDMATRVFKNGTKVSVQLQHQQRFPTERVPNIAKDCWWVYDTVWMRQREESLQLLGITAL